MANFREKAISGVKWSALGQVIIQATTMISSIVLARLLSPKEFGLMALITVMTGFASLLASFGLGTAIVQSKEVSNRDLSSVFWFSTFVGIGLFLSFFLGSSLIARFYDDLSLETLITFVSANFIFGGLSMVHAAILDRRLAFKELAICSITSVGISYILGISLAIFKFGVWALAVQSVTNAFITTILLWHFSKWKPEFNFNKSSFNKYKTFGFYIFSINVFDYIANNIDVILIGKFISKKRLGEYGRSYAFLMLPVVNVSTVITKVVFPSLSHIQDDKVRVAKVYFGASRILAFITLPMMIGLAVESYPFVYIVFGEQWLGMVPMLQLLSLIGIFASLNALHEPIILSQGRVDLLFKLAPFEKGGIIGSVLLGLNWGVIGIIICKAILIIIFSLIKFWLLSKSIKVSLFSIFKNLFPSASISLAMGTIVYIFNKYFYSSFSEDIMLVAGVSTGILTYLVLVFLFDKSIITELKGFFK